MLDSMKYGTYIFFAAFSAMGGIFVWLACPETKDKTLEELDIYFGGDSAGLAVADRERMDRINESLGLSGVEDVNQLNEKPGFQHEEANEVENENEKTN